MGDKEKCAVLALQIQKLLLTISLDLTSRSTTIDDQMLWDKYDPMFEKIVDLAQSVLLISSSSSTPTSVNYFTLDMAIVGPLYDVARSCRDPHIRRKAISLLRKYPRQEGLWDGVLAARVAERIMVIEETSVDYAAFGVPRWARISEVVPTFDAERKQIALRYERYSDADSLIKTSVQEVITWA